jgi:hypothetical protein
MRSPILIYKENPTICYNVGFMMILSGREGYSFLAEEIWVSVAQATQMTGYNHDHVRRLARESWRLPEDHRRIRVRKDDHAYEIWLPDLINYIERRIPPPALPNIDLSDIEETWVSSTEAAEMTGYNRQYLSKLAMEMSGKPEKEREIRIKKRPAGTEMWLPDLMAYRYRVGRGPKKRNK